MPYKKIVTLIFLPFFGSLFLLGSTLPHMGRVISNGKPFEGEGSFWFALINDANQTVWNHEGSADIPNQALRIPVQNGFYQIGLGDQGIPGMSPLDPSLLLQWPNLKLRIWFDDGINGIYQLGQDQALDKAPYSIASDHLRDRSMMDSMSARLQFLEGENNQSMANQINALGKRMDDLNVSGLNSRIEVMAESKEQLSLRLEEMENNESLLLRINAIDRKVDDLNVSQINEGISSLQGSDIGFHERIEKIEHENNQTHHAISREASARIAQLESQLSLALARVEAMEARQIAEGLESSMLAKVGFKNLPNALLNSVDLSGLENKRVNFQNAQLSNSILDSGDFTEGNFKDANLTSSSVGNAKIQYADFIRSIIVDANLSGTDFSGSDFSESNLTGSIMQNADLRNANFKGADFTDMNLSGSNIINAGFSGAIFKNTTFSDGSLLNGYPQPPTGPIRTWTFSHTYFIKSDGSLWSWKVENDEVIVREIMDKGAKGFARGNRDTFQGIIKEDGSLWRIKNDMAVLVNHFPTLQINRGKFDESYLFSDGSLWLGAEKIAENVLHMSQQGWVSTNVIYYVKTDGSLWEFHETIDPNDSALKNFENTLLVDSGVSSIVSSFESAIVFTKTDGSLWYRNVWDENVQEQMIFPFGVSFADIQSYGRFFTTWDDPVNYLMCYVRTDGSLWVKGIFKDGYLQEISRVIYSSGSENYAEKIISSGVVQVKLPPHMNGRDGRNAHRFDGYDQDLLYLLNDGSLWLSGSEFWDESNASRPPLKIADDLLMPTTEKVQLKKFEHSVEPYHVTGLDSDQEGQDLSGFYLKNYNLSFFDFEDANLSGANLSGTDLTGANLLNSNLTGSNLLGVTYNQTIMPDGRIRTDDVISDFENSSFFKYWREKVDNFDKTIVNRTVAVFFLKKDMTLWGVGRNNSGEYLSSPSKILDGPIVGFVDENRYMKQDGSIWELSFSPVPVELTQLEKIGIPESYGIDSFRGIESGKFYETGFNEVQTVDNGKGKRLGYIIDGSFFNESLFEDQKVSELLKIGIREMVDEYFVLNDSSLWNVSEEPERLMESGVSQIKVWGASTVAAGKMFVRKEDGSLWAKGYSGDGLTPIMEKDVKEVVNGSGATFVIKTNGSLWAMGRNQNGELGVTPEDGNYTIPLQVVDSGVKNVYPLANRTFFSKEDGSLWGMGENSAGQLGDGTMEDRDLPVKILETGFKEILESGSDITFFMKDDNSLWGMGNQRDGDLGTGDTSRQESPVQVAGAGVNSFFYASSSSDPMLFLKKDGTLWGTGRNSNAILGDRDPESSTQRVTVPRQIANGVLLPSE